MDRAKRNALMTLAAISLVTADLAMAQDSSRKFYAVICTSDARGPWTMKAQGTLTRTRSGGEMSYRFESSAHTFEWRLTTSPEGQTTFSGPGFLMQQFDAVPPAATKQQKLETTGEIRELAGSKALALL